MKTLIAAVVAAALSHCCPHAPEEQGQCCLSYRCGDQPCDYHCTCDLCPADAPVCAGG